MATLLATPAGVPTATGAPTPASDHTGWDRLDPRLPTPWTDEVSPRNALPEYPRPQLTRPDWKNLNGVWEFAGAAANERPPFGETLAERVLVPYPIESDLSGIGRHEDYMWYRRTVVVPKAWKIGDGHRLLMHFGAVDYEATVYVNGEEVTTHTGGYGKFDVDVTDALTASGPQEIVVGVEDRGDATWQPVGKQRLVADRGIFYEGASGIWQTAWIEPVAAGYVTGLETTPDVDRNRLAMTVQTAGRDNGLKAQVVVRDGDTVVARRTLPTNTRTWVTIPKAKLWSPDSPFLYDLTVRLKSGPTTVVDSVDSYVGMREIGTAVGPDGKRHITLNGKPLFLMSTLDQGYWPDGIYTAPTDEALAFDLEQTKRLGFNTVRKHIKVEPDRFYYHADQLGLMVWQDMPAMRTGGRPPVAAQQQYERELAEMIEQKKSWTSIIGWIPFNEGWGEWNRDATGRIANEVKQMDPSRLVDAHSGVNCCDSLGDSGAGDVLDWHQYLGPGTPSPTADRASMDGEHGGFGLEVDDHMWFEDGGAYQMLPDSTSLTDAYVQNQRAVMDAAQVCGISGAVYTQTTDVEHEVNGFFTYDREVEKMDFDRVRAVNRAIIRNADGTGVPEPDPGTPGLEGIAAYPFDEGSGSTAEDTVGDADASLTGATWTDGVNGGAVSFDGNGEADTGRQLVDPVGSYTVSARVRLDATGGGGFQTVASQDTGNASSFFLQYSGGDQKFAMSFVGVRALSDVQPVAGRWYQLTGVRDAATGALSLYVDGELQSTQYACQSNDAGGDTVFGRGQFDGQPVDRLRGDLDDARVFDRALSADEVAQLAEQG